MLHIQLIISMFHYYEISNPNYTKTGTYNL